MALIQLITIVSFFGLWLIPNSQNYIFKKNCIFLKGGETAGFLPGDPHNVNLGARCYLRPGLSSPPWWTLPLRPFPVLWAIPKSR